MELELLEAELDALAQMNQGRLHALELEVGPIQGLDMLYNKSCLEHLIGSYALPQLRLLYQRQVAAVCDDFEGQLPKLKLELSRENKAASAALPSDFLGKGGRRR